MWRVFSRLKTNGYLGAVEYPSLTIDMNAQLLAKSTANSTGVVCIGDGDKSTLILRPQLDDTTLFSGAACGYATPNGQNVQFPTGTTEQQFPGTVALAENQPFYISYLAFRNTAEADQAEDVRIGFGKWRLLFFNGAAYLAYINENWTLTKERTALFGNQELQGPREYNGEDVSNATAIYDVFQSLNTNDDTQAATTGGYTYLWIIPQPGLGVYVATGKNPFGTKKQNVELVELPERLQSDVIYPAGVMNVYARQTPFIINGRPLKFENTVLVAGPYSNGAINDLVGDITWNINKNTPAGTSVTAEETSIGFTSFGIKLFLNTDDDGIYTPFIYRVSASNPGGTYDNITGEGYDSSEDMDAQGNPPVMDISMTCDGEMRRHQYEVSIRQAGNVLAQLSQKAGLLENQLCDLTMGLSLAQQNPIITGGIIQPCGAFNVGGMTEDGFKNWTELRAVVNDKWKIAEDQIIGKVLPGDGMRLGKYIKYVLNTLGFAASEISISDDTGITLPQAMFGESPCVIPYDMTSGADYLRDLMDYYGFDLTLYVGADGKWYLQPVSQNLATVGGESAQFSSSATRNSSTTYPGRLAILGMNGPDWIRDSSEFYNAISVEGGEVRGNRLGARYIDQRSIYDPTAPNFIGRFKPYPTVRNDAWRTQDVVLMVTRSLAMRYAISSRLFQFETYFHIELFTNDQIELDGVRCRIKCINSATIANDRMSITAQEIQV